MKVQVTARDPQTIPEVVAFEQAKASLEAFRNDNQTVATPAQVLATYDQLINSYNEAMQNADKAVRALEVSCGDWDLYSSYTKVDWEKLYAALGRDDFLSVAGGKLGSSVKISGDQKTFDLAAAKGHIPTEVIEGCTTIEHKYHAPKKAVTI